MAKDGWPGRTSFVYAQHIIPPSSPSGVEDGLVPYCHLGLIISCDVSPLISSVMHSVLRELTAEKSTCCGLILDPSYYDVTNVIAVDK